MTFNNLTFNILCHIFCQLMTQTQSHCITANKISWHPFHCTCNSKFNIVLKKILPCFLQLCFFEWFIMCNDKTTSVWSYKRFIYVGKNIYKLRTIFKVTTKWNTEEVITLIKDFLSYRKRKVVLKGQHSSWADVKAGAAQGSILGLLLLLIYINELPNVLNSKFLQMIHHCFLLFIILPRMLESLTSSKRLMYVQFTPSSTG